MGLTAINPARYGKLCAKVLPTVIKTREEFDRMVEQMEALDRKANRTPEDEALSELLMRLIQDYDDAQYPVLPSKPYKALQEIMKQRGLKQIDLVPVLGSRPQVSSAVNGTRGISKAQAKRLAEFFRCSVKLFI